ncbi:serine--tRNA ligase [Candidatus Woesearchaeota archaeon]|nr:serine--tRNA ligase [Candidatus Woesearchaeota archaeon]
MLDIKFIRENPDKVKANIKKKFQDHKLKLVDELLDKDKKYREIMQKTQKLRHQRNIINQEINKLQKAGKDIKKKVKEAKELPKKLKDLEEKQEQLGNRIYEIMKIIPQMIHKSVPIGRNDKDNVEIEKIGKVKAFNFPVKSHVELAEELDIADFETSAETSGNGFYYLKGELALLQMALINFARDFMVKKGYRYYEPPLMIRKRVVEGVMSFEEMENMMYKIDSEDLYMIGTSEHPLIGAFIDRTLKEEELPIKITGYSMCFRKEIGSHGIDEKGLYRTHQFNKQEMIVICKPEDSYKFYDEMLELTKAVFKKLGLPCRVFECCSGDLADLKAKSCDLEAWSPRKKEYFEVASLTNMEDAQARRLNIKATDGKQKYLVHTLNNTVIATSRALVAILENFQNKDGSVNIPKALHPYMNGIKVIGKKKKEATKKQKK